MNSSSASTAEDSFGGSDKRISLRRERGSMLLEGDLGLNFSEKSDCVFATWLPCNPTGCLVTLNTSSGCYIEMTNLDQLTWRTEAYNQRRGSCGFALAPGRSFLVTGRASKIRNRCSRVGAQD